MVSSMGGEHVKWRNSCIFEPVVVPTHVKMDCIQKNLEDIDKVCKEEFFVDNVTRPPAHHGYVSL